MKRIIPALLLCLAIALLAAQPGGPVTAASGLSTAPDQPVEAQSVLVLDRDSGQPLYEKNARQRVYPASITKLMTALIAAEQTKSLDGTVVTVRQEVLDQLPLDDNSLAGLAAGERYTMRQLLYCLLLPSGNDAALVIADSVGGSVDEFVERMNRRAAELGCQDTWFVNPHGLAGEEQYSTAWDLALIAEAFMQKQALAKIAGTHEYSFSLDGRDVTLKNSDLLLDEESWLYDPGAVGVKTGITSLGAGFVSAAEQDGLRFMCVVAGVQARDAGGMLISPNPALAEAKKLHDWVYASFERVELCGRQTEFPLSEDGLGPAAVTGGTVTALIPREKAAQVYYTVTAARSWRARFLLGAPAGYVCWYCDGMPVTGPVPLYLKTTSWLIMALFLLAVLAAVLAALSGRQRRRSQAAESASAGAIRIPPAGPVPPARPRAEDIQWRKETPPENDRRDW